MVARPQEYSTDRHRGFQNVGLPNPVFTVENSADNNPIHATQSKSVHTTCMVLNPLLQNIRRLLDLLNCTKSNLRNSEEPPGQC